MRVGRGPWSVPKLCMAKPRERKEASQVGGEEAKMASSECSHVYASPAELLAEGDACVARGDLAAALDAYQVAVSMADRMAEGAPGHAECLGYVALSHYKLGRLYQQLAEATSDDWAVQAAQQCWLRSRDALRAMDAAGMDLDAGLANLLEQFEKLPG